MWVVKGEMDKGISQHWMATHTETNRDALVADLDAFVYKGTPDSTNS